MFPTTGTDGWAALGAIDPLLFPLQEPRQQPLPMPHVADYYDPSPLGGLGILQESVSLLLGGDDIVVRAGAASVEARFTQANVFGVGLLDSFVALFIGAPCSVVLTVFADDGVTVLWEVGTDPTHPRPYLLQPDQYQEQEIDVAAGTATLGTVSVMVIDPATIAGDQDSGWLTERLAFLGLPDIAGHRCRLIRYISVALGYQVVTDGPAGTVRMDSSYAAYTWEIRDTRETERRIRCFETVVLSLLPDELPEGYAPDSGVGVARARPLRGRFEEDDVSSVDRGNIRIDLASFPTNGRRKVMTKAAYEAVINGTPRVGGLEGFGGTAGDQPITVATRNQFAFRWRAQGSGDPWVEVPGSTLHISLSTIPSAVIPDGYVVDTIAFLDRRLNPLAPEYDPAATPLPTDNQNIEFFLYGPVAPDERHFAIVESLPPIAPGTGVFNPANLPVLGRFEVAFASGGTTSGTIDLTALPGNTEDFRRMPSGTFDRLGNLSTIGDIFIPTGGDFAWRAAGSADPWIIVPLNPAAPGGSSIQLFMQTPIGYLSRVFLTVIVAGPTTQMPADAADIEFTLTVDPPTTAIMTAGQFAANVYAGLYSPRDPLTGAVMLTGIRYDEAALRQITDPVRIRLAEPIEDARAWLEARIYAPTGWVPALDSAGRISPVSQVMPVDTSALTVLHNGIVEPSSDWDSGQRIINVLRFAYQRDFDAGAPDAPISGGEDRQSDIGTREVPVEFRDEVSIVRHGEQVLELDGSAFRAVGATDVYAEAVGTQLQKWNGATAGEALPPGQSAEAAYQLAQARRIHVHNRYSLGAPALSFNVVRSAVPLLRAGSWVWLDLSWFPDYVTQRRGLLALGQIVALGDLDCAWRRLLIEQVVPLPESS